ncbi:MAG: hypothetical protein PHP86_05710 [Nevskiales bacterium]|nr:hypothetical protein [Nevskiales bacterium]
MVLKPAHLRRTGSVALIVGSWLTLANLGDALFAGAWSLGIGIKIVLNYLTPLVVANIGLLSRSNDPAP